MVNVMKGGGRASPPSPAWANFTLMMESTPESNDCYSVFSVAGTLSILCSLTGRYGYSGELARLSNVRLKPTLLDTKNDLETIRDYITK